MSIYIKNKLFSDILKENNLYECFFNDYLKSVCIDINNSEKSITLGTLISKSNDQHVIDFWK